MNPVQRFKMTLITWKSKKESNDSLTLKSQNIFEVK